MCDVMMVLITFVLYICFRLRAWVFELEAVDTCWFLRFGGFCFIICGVTGKLGMTWISSSVSNYFASSSVWDWFDCKLIDNELRRKIRPFIFVFFVWLLLARVIQLSSSVWDWSVLFIVSVTGVDYWIGSCWHLLIFSVLMIFNLLYVGLQRLRVL